MRIYGVYTCDVMLDVLDTYHQREWAADWHAWKLAWDWSEKDRKYAEGPEWRLTWIANPWAGHPGWGFGPYASEAYSYVVPIKVTVP